MEDNFKHPADEKKVKFRANSIGSKKETGIWIFLITIISFFISIFMSFFSNETLGRASTVVSFLIVFVIIIISILFDIIGVAATAADEAPFHSMASRKLYGAKQAVKLIRNADKVSNFCNDVVGDICGVISGTAAAFIVYKFSGSGTDAQNSIFGLSITAMVASLTVGGKALGKSVALQNSNYIIYKVAVVIKFLFGKFHIKKNRKWNNKKNWTNKGTKKE
ncbi:MAG TPA: Mg2+ and Co2+ transporter CorB [Ruminiclostridium sp.]|nr:Mg2+ and Co2+ transporter CorB [Ruminiclostridium sp.]